MKKQIVIIGTDPIAFQIAKTLCEEPNSDVYIIESSESRYNEINDILDAVVILGYEANPEILKAANIEKADILLALHKFDSINITVSLIAKHYNPKIKIIGTIDSLSYENYFSFFQDDKAIIDYLVSPELISAETTLQFVKHPSIIDYKTVLKGKFVILGIEIKNGHNFISKKLFEVKKEGVLLSMLIVSMMKNGEMIIPYGDTVIEAGDILYILAPKKNSKSIFEFFCILKEETEKILIGGGGRYARAFLEASRNKGFKITVLEHDKIAIDKIKHRFPDVEVIDADVRNLDSMEQREIFSADYYLAMTDNEYVNFVSSVYAKQIGKMHVIALAYQKDQIDALKRHNIHITVNPKSLIIGKIHQYLHTDSVISIISLWNEQVQMSEIIVPSGCLYLSKPLKELILEEGVLIGVVEHNGSAHIADGNTIIHEGDKILVFAKQKKLDIFLKSFF
ncbi:NAD-binding protein [bacterium]|nr:NAD-binding protein [bacterium]